MGLLDLNSRISFLPFCEDSTRRSHYNLPVAPSPKYKDDKGKAAAPSAPSLPGGTSSAGNGPGPRNLNQGLTMLQVRAAVPGSRTVPREGPHK